MPKNNKVCLMCKGVGYVNSLVCTDTNLTNVFDRNVYTRKVMCDKCKGTGKVNKKNYIN